MTKSGREKERETERDRQTERQIGTDRQRDRERQTDIQTDRDRDTATETKTDRRRNGKEERHGEMTQKRARQERESALGSTRSVVGTSCSC